MTTSPYEFSESQNTLIRDLAQKMQFVAYFAMAFGAIAILGGLFTIVRGGFGALIQGVVSLLIGWWTINASQAFKRIVSTEGNDIENLIGALGELRKLYTLQFWLLIVALAFAVIGLVAGLILGIAQVGQ
jgi:hypothetical protein